MLNVVDQQCCDPVPYSVSSSLDHDQMATATVGVSIALHRGHLSLSPLPRSIPSEAKYSEQPASMSSNVQATSSTSSTSNIQLITDALVDYANITGIDLSKNPFAVAIEGANSPGAILELLQEREKAFKNYREGNRRLISCLTPAVNVIQAFSGVLGQAIGLVSRHTYHLVTLFTLPRQVPFPPAKALFVGIDVLLSVCPFIRFKPVSL